jgi:hypothetical protein
MPMTGIYRVQDSGNSLNLENRRQTRRNLSGSVEELYNEIEKSIAAGFKQILSKVLKLEIWPNQLRFS